MQRLEQWIKDNKMTQQDFAERIGTTQGCVSRWCAGTAIPRPEVMAKIVELTGGDVQPNDFYKGE